MKLTRSKGKILKKLLFKKERSILPPLLKSNYQSINNNIVNLSKIDFLNELLKDTNRIIEYTTFFLKQNKDDKKTKINLLTLRKYYIRARMSIIDRIKNYKDED